MKQIGKRIISTLLSLCMLFTTSVVLGAENTPAPLEANTEVRELDTSYTTLTGYYKVTESRELKDLKVSGTAVIYIAKDVTLTVYGTKGSGMTPGKPAIELTKGNILFITGEGSLIARGGDSGGPTVGENGGGADWLSGTRYNSVFCSGAGGNGGDGGGGAGAGIGTSGGRGGKGGIGGSSVTCVMDEVYSSDGWMYGTEATDGADGERASTDVGSLYVLGTVFVEGRGGNQGWGGDAGNIGEGYYSINFHGYRKTIGAGGAGGGGGGGDYGDSFGAGGGGGGGGGGGAAGCIRYNQLGYNMPVYYGQSGGGGENWGKRTHGYSKTRYYYYTYDGSLPTDGRFSYTRPGNDNPGGSGGKNGFEKFPGMTVNCTGETEVYGLGLGGKRYEIDSPSITELATDSIALVQNTLTLMNDSEAYAKRYLTYGHTKVTDAIVFPAPQREGYAFQGYYRTADAAAKLSEADRMIDSSGNAIVGNWGDSLNNGRWTGVNNLTLYAGWKKSDTAVTLACGDGATIEYGTIYVNVSDPYGYMPVPSKTGLSFGGWFTKDGTDDDWGSEVLGGTAVTDNENHILYTKWIRGIPDTEIEIPKQTYTGLAQTPEPRVTYYGQELRKDIDYSVTYSNNINAGQASLTVTGTGIYEGEKTASFTIECAPLTITGAVLAEKIYDGSAGGTAVDVIFDGLQNGETMHIDSNGYYDDYSAIVVYDDANAGENRTATVAVELHYWSKVARNYVIGADEAFLLTGQTINRRPITDDDLYILPLVRYVVLPNEGDFVEPLAAFGATGDFTYSNGGGAYEDYEKTKAKLKDLPTGTEDSLNCKFIANGNYIGEANATLPFTVEDVAFTANGEKANAENVFNKKIENPTYGDSWEDIVSLKDNLKLVASIGWEDDDNQDHFSLNVSGKPDAGEAQEYQVLYNGIMCGLSFADYVVCSGKVNVAKNDISGATVTLGEPLTYNGKSQAQSVESVVVDGVTLTENTDYTVSCDSKTNAGTYILTVTGIGGCEGTVTKEWKIQEKSLTITAKAQTLTYPDKYIADGVEQVIADGLADGDALTYIWLTGRSIFEFGEGIIEPEGATIMNGKADNTANYIITYKKGLLIKNYEVRFVISKDCFTPALEQDVVYKSEKTINTSYDDFPTNEEVEAYLAMQYGVYPVDFRWRDEFGYTLDESNTLDKLSNVGYGTFWCDDISLNFYDADGLYLDESDGYPTLTLQSINNLVLPTPPEKDNPKGYTVGWSLSQGGECVSEKKLKEALTQDDFEGTFDLYAVYKPCNFTSSDIKFSDENGKAYTASTLAQGEKVKAVLTSDSTFGISNPVLILALFDGDTFVKMVYSDKATSDGLSIETPVITSDRDNLTAKAFVWDSLSGQAPLCESVSLGK